MIMRKIITLLLSALLCTVASAAPLGTPADNEIWYTTRSRQPASFRAASFDAKIVENKVVGDKIVLRFDKPLTSLGYFAFIGEEFTSISIPNSVTTVSENVCMNCDNLTHFYGKFSTADHRALIVDGVLIRCGAKGLTKYDVPYGVRRIASCAFSFNPLFRGSDFYKYEMGEITMDRSRWSLTHLSLPSTVEEIGDYAFQSCYNLEVLNIPASVKKIGKGIFDGVYSLVSVTWDSDCKPTALNKPFYNLLSIYGKYASADNRCLVYNGSLVVGTMKGLTSYTLPSSVRVIERHSLINGKMLTSLTLPESVTNIKSAPLDYSFDNIQNFYGKFATEGGSGLVQEGRLIEVAVARLQKGAQQYIDFNIPEGIEVVDENLFFECENISIIRLPSTIKVIAYNSMPRQFKNTRSIYIKASTPPELNSALRDIQKIYVPYSAVEAYKIAKKWEVYADKIVGYNF